MKTDPRIGFYPPMEEKLNIISHGFGFALSILGMVLLIYRAGKYGEFLHLISFSIFGASLILLYAASTFYHSAKRPKLRYRLNILDHASIYVLIAGTYTPFALITLSGVVGWSIFIVVWGLAVTGVILKLFYTGRFRLLSTSMYVIMGWIIVFAIKPLIANLELPGLLWLFAGGISYTLGAVFFSIERINYNHAIFHLFVLAGSFCHYISIFLYVLPG
ncbi:hemolysin III family protein [soil metagenome]